MTHSPKIIHPVPPLREAIVELLRGHKTGLRTMTYGGVSFAVSGSQDDRDELADVLESQMLQQPPGQTQQAEAQTVHTELNNGNLVILENHRPKPSAGGYTQEELREYALEAIAPFIELAEQGKILAFALVAGLVDDGTYLTYPVDQWEPGLIAGTLLLQRNLMDQV